MIFLYVLGWGMDKWIGIMGLRRGDFPFTFRGLGFGWGIDLTQGMTGLKTLKKRLICTRLVINELSRVSQVVR
jgi:hypothetical protein